MSTLTTDRRAGGDRVRRAGTLWLATPLALLASSALVYQSSTAAFTATTDNPGNEFRSGQVVLDDSRSGTALFTTASEGLLVPGSTGFRCIDVTYSGDVAADVRLHAAYGAQSSLAPYLEIEIDQVSATAPCAATGDLTGDGALFGTPAATASTLVADHGGYATGLGTWAPTGAAADTRRYRVSYTLVDDDAAQHKQLELALTWEAHNS